MIHKNLKRMVLISFNRYMVECEYGFLPWNQVVPDVLIDTWWNVNE